ncbi:hypothetical protein TUBRATIS_007170 [Tubulinosema ratisbonensis]|uniref:Uncharacterized protein n=1 Tax=Tubulinosema ratisbonensis TaxID=291195 RepID=A0A437ANX3_9MICR|nr:hypothetical protein TUBRATIS_007170 [Tubulinosema ratisbonensis]
MHKSTKWKMVFYLNLVNLIFYGVVMNLRTKARKNYPLFYLYSSLTEENVLSKNTEELNKYFVTKDYKRIIDIYHKDGSDPFKDDIVIIKKNKDILGLYFQKDNLKIRYNISVTKLIKDKKIPKELNVIIQVLYTGKFIYPYIRITEQESDGGNFTFAYSEQNICKISSSLKDIKQFLHEIIKTEHESNKK